MIRLFGGLALNEFNEGPDYETPEFIPEELSSDLCSQAIVDILNKTIKEVRGILK